MTRKIPTRPQLRAIDIDPGPDTLTPRQAWISRPIWAEFLADETVIALRFHAQGGHPELAEVRVYPWDHDEDRLLGEWSGNTALVPESGLSPVLIRNLPLGSLRDEVLANLAHLNPEVWPGADLEDRIGAWWEVTGRGSIQPHRNSEPERRGGRKPTISNLELAKVSFYYQEAARLGRKIHRYIEGQMPEIDNVVTNRIFKAREKGFLVGGGGERGRKGGVMSEKAVKVLLEHGILQELVREVTE